MVFEKRLDYYGFNGYWAPAVPRASRSARRKRSFRRKTEGNQLYAFDLLATVAGELSLLKESSVPSSDRSPGRAENVAAKDTVKSESRDEEKPFKYDPCGKGGSLESASATEVGLHQHDADYSLKGCLHAQDDVTLLSTSMKVKFESSDKVNHADQSLPGKVKDDPIQGICHTESHSPGIAESHDSKVDIAIKEQLKVGKQVIGDTINGTAPDIFMTEDPKELDVNTPKLVNSDSSIGAPLCGDHISSGLLLRCQDDVKIVVSRDDDENSSRCTQPGTIPLKAFRPPHLGNRRIRKLLTSKVSRVAPRLLKDGKRYNKDFETKPIFRGKESCYTRQRTQRCSPFKRRKLFGRSSASMFEGGVGSGSVSISPGKGNNGAVGYGASRVSTPVAGRESSFKCDDSRVKLSIKSFRVPELFIEIPETATVGSLKRTVVEAVTAILGGGLRVGVLLQGKKVRDDNRTLLQTGIARDDKLETLGFMLEPNPPDPLPSLCPESRNLLLPCDAAGPPTRYPVPIPDPVPPQNLPLTNADNCNKSGPNSVPCHADMSLEKERPNSRALVAIPTMSVEALTVVPLPRKSRRSELVQRRIRRPFSVSEVEALVQAVEKLGTGRWRDVKIRAFENAKHRTYVDLKDKWKTLVHTARISPQQRRGEPVPQELLDRVLSAHAYWSQQQSKDHTKLQAEPSYL